MAVVLDAFAETVGHIVGEIALVITFAWIGLLSMAFDDAAGEVALVFHTGPPYEYTFTMGPAILEGAVVVAFRGQRQNALIRDDGLIDVLGDVDDLLLLLEGQLLAAELAEHELARIVELQLSSASGTGQGYQSHERE